MMADEHAKLGHAIDFVSNHLPHFGQENYRSQADFAGEKEQEISPNKMDHVQGTVRMKLNRALEAALDYITREFTDEPETESGTVQTSEPSHPSSSSGEGAKGT
jgi:hypothetical protein